MELPVSQQMLQLLAAFALGAALGLLFDAFRVLRRRARAAWMRALLDVLYSAAALFALFTFGMVSGAGQVRLFMLAAVAAGCACYGAFASAACLRALEAVAAQLAKAVRFLARPFVFCQKKLKKFLNFAKKHFQNAAKCFRINCIRTSKRAKTQPEPEGRRTDDEIQEGRHHYQDRH